MALLKLYSLFPTVATSDFAIKNKKYLIKKTAEERKILVVPECVPPEHKYLFDRFLSLIDVDPSEIDNYGIATYDRKGLKYHSPVYFGKDENDQLGITIGIKSDDFLTKSMFIPCEVELATKRKGKKDIEYYSYTLNGVEIELKPAVDNDGNETGKFYLEMEDEEDAYRMSFLINKEQEYTPDEIKTAFKEGRFHEVVRRFGSGGGNQRWIRANLAFLNHFENGTFPEEGVMFLCRNGQIKITPKEKYDTETDMVNAEWEILATSHPDLMIQYEIKKEIKNCLLDEATILQFSNASVNNEGYGYLVSNGYQYYEGLVVIHIVEPRKNIKHTPFNTVSAEVESIEEKLEAFPRLMMAYNDRKALAAGQTQEVKIPVNMPDISPFDEKKAYESMGNAITPVDLTEKELTEQEKAMANF